MFEAPLHFKPGLKTVEPAFSVPRTPLKQGHRHCLELPLDNLVVERHLAVPGREVPLEGLQVEDEEQAAGGEVLLVAGYPPGSKFNNVKKYFTTYVVILSTKGVLKE